MSFVEYNTGSQGVSRDGKFVVSGDVVFKHHDTFGLPWEVIFGELQKKGMYFDVVGLCLKLAGSYGWDKARCLTELSFPIKDTYGPEMLRVVERILV